jgi:hypothetical protein
MATEPRAVDDNVAAAEPTERTERAMRRRGPRVDPNDMISPTCMIWIMFIGLAIFAVIIFSWILSTGIDLIG